MMRNRLNGTALWCAALLALVALGTAVSAGAKATAPTVKVFFGQGEQLVAVSAARRDRSGLRSTALDRRADRARDGSSRSAPTCRRAAACAASRMDGHHRRRRPRRRLHAGATAVDTTLARLDQVVSTVTAVPGVTSVRLLINGGTPLGLFPGVDATVPADARALATPNVPATRPCASQRAGVELHEGRCSSASPRSATCCPTPSTASTGPAPRPR